MREDTMVHALIGVAGGLPDRVWIERSFFTGYHLHAERAGHFYHAKLPTAPSTALLQAVAAGDLSRYAP
jgi:hypothetical protein